MSKHFESGSSKHSKVTKVAATTVSACVVAGALLVMAFIPGRQLSFGNANPANASVVQEVSPKVMDQYCPAQMGLADTGTYGDREFQASVGDLASSARYAAFGSIFHAQVSPLGDDSKSTVLQGPQSDDADSTADSVVVASSDSAEAPQVFETAGSERRNRGEWIHGLLGEQWRYRRCGRLYMHQHAIEPELPHFRDEGGHHPATAHRESYRQVDDCAAFHDGDGTRADCDGHAKQCRGWRRRTEDRGSGSRGT